MDCEDLSETCTASNCDLETDVRKSDTTDLESHKTMMNVTEKSSPSSGASSIRDERMSLDSSQTYESPEECDGFTETSLLDSSTGTDVSQYFTAGDDSSKGETTDETDFENESSKRTLLSRIDQRMSVDSVSNDGDMKSGSDIIKVSNRDQRMSVNSSPIMSGKAGDATVVYDRTNNVPVQSQLVRLQEVQETTEMCLEENRLDEARTSVHEEYVILELLSRTSEELPEDVDVAEDYFHCAESSLACNLKMQAIRCYYKAILAMKDGEVQLQFHIGYVVKFWASILGPGMTLDEILSICREVRDMADERMCTSGQRQFNVPMAIYMDVILTYNRLIVLFEGNTKLRDEKLKTVLAVSECFMQADKYEILMKNICKPLTHREYSDSPEIHEVWALCLQKLGDPEIALKKAETAVALAKTPDHRVRLADLIGKLQSDIEAKRQNLDGPIKPEWLEGTNINETKKNAKTCKNLIENHVKKTRRRPKAITRHPIDFYSSLKDWKDIKATTQQTGQKSGARQLDDCYGFPFNGRKKKRRRRNTAGSEASTSSMVVDELECSDPDVEEQFDPFQTSFGNIVQSEESDSEEDEQYENAMEEIEDDEEDEDEVEAQENDLLMNGINLSQRLVNKLQIKDEHYYYHDSLSESQLTNLLRTEPNRYKKCTLQIQSAHKSLCTLVKPEENLKEIEISGRSKAGKHLSGDVVVVEVLKYPEPKTKKTHDIIPRLNKEIPMMNEEENLKAYGKVVGQLGKGKTSKIAHPVFVCDLDEFEYHLMRPLCKSVPKISVLKRHVENKFQIERYNYIPEDEDIEFAELKHINPSEKRSYLFLVAFVRWDLIYPTGVVLKIIRSEGALSKAMKIQRFHYRVPTTYHEETMQAVQNIMAESADEEWLDKVHRKDREDLTNCLSAFTIDPPNSRDLDDALNIKKMDDGSFCVGIHIADVTAYVKKNDPIDKEAQDRATTFYPGQGYNPYHMIPKDLSENKCSLLPNERRLALSIFVYLDENGRPIRGRIPELKKTIIRSKRQFSYQEVQQIIMNDDEETECSEDLKLMYRLAKKLRRIRLGDAIHALPVEVDSTSEHDSVLKSVEAHYLVEEFMILANGIAAGFACKHFRKCVPLRCQDAPTDDLVQEWLKSYPLVADVILKLQGIKPIPTKKISIRDAKPRRYTAVMGFQKWVWEALENAVENENYRQAWKLIGSDEYHPQQSVAYSEWIKLQEQATYRCTGVLTNRKQGWHFSLNTGPYCHFTSPIRRYPDIILHRLIHAALEEESCPYTTEEVDALCRYINDVSKRAKSYQRQCETVQIGYRFKNNPRMFHGFVNEVSLKEIAFHIPGMHRLSESCKEIPLQFLGVSKRPEIVKDKDTDRDILRLHWQRRIYSHRGFAPRTKFDGTFRLDPHSHSIFQQYNTWIDILKALLNENKGLLKKHMVESSRNKQHGTDDMLRRWIPTCFDTVTDVSSEKHRGPITKHLIDFEMTFSHAQVIGIQLFAEPHSGVLVPCPQVLDLSNNVKICLQHAMDPVKYLGKHGTNRSKGPNAVYKGCAEYLQVWLPMLNMESATAAVKEDSITINNLPVLLRRSGGKFTLKRGFCRKRNIKFVSIPDSLILTGEHDQTDHDTDDENDEFHEEKSCSHYVCVKQEVNNEGNGATKGSPDGKHIWVGHGHFSKTKKNKKEIKVYFNLHPSSNSPSVDCKERNMSLEIMEKPRAYSRTEATLNLLQRSSKLAKAVAFGHKVPAIDGGHLALSKEVGFDMAIEGLARNNGKQYEAIKKALTSSFTLIQGPPGTGKTYTGIKLIYLFTKINLLWKERGNDMNQVVFCGPSNKSVDLVARWMRKKLGAASPKFVRIYGSALENIDFPIPGREMSTRSKRGGSHPDPELRDVSIHCLIRQDGKPYADDIKFYDMKFKNLKPDELTGEDMNAYWNDIEKFEKLLNKATIEELTHHDVIFCTTAMATNPRFLEGIGRRVYQCIIDECGMCTEPESIATLIATKAKQVVLIGDHKQLRPVIQCTAAADLGLEKSLFERYADRATMLTTQYRMNPRICDFVSEQFYENRLQTGPSTAWTVEKPLSIWPNPLLPIAFCHIDGAEVFQTVATEEGNERSCRNMEEVEKVIKVFSRLVWTERVPVKKINIVSQYNAQCNEIREQLKSKKFTEEDGLNINTVVASQGGEWDYVIFSTVRSLPEYKIEETPTIGWCHQNLGFITDAHQINVALSRARKGLIIIGNKELLSCDTIWGKLLDHYHKKGCVYATDRFPPPKKYARRCRSQSARASRQTSEDFYRGTDMEMDL